MDTKTMLDRAEIVAYAREQVAQIIADSLADPEGVERYWSRSGVGYMKMWTDIVLALKDD